MAGATALGSAQQRPAVPPALQNYKPVTADRLKKPDDGDWLMVRRTYDGWGYSPLTRDHARQRRAPAACVGRLDRRQQRTRGGAHRQQRRNVRRHARQPGHRARRGVRPDPLAISAAAAGRRDPAAPDQPRRRAVRRQGVLRRRRRRARRARRQNRTRSLDHEGRGESERLLHVARRRSSPTAK